MLPQFFSCYATKTAAGRLSCDSVFPRTQLLKVRVDIKPDSEFDSLAEINFYCTTTTTYCQQHFLVGCEMICYCKFFDR